MFNKIKAIFLILLSDYRIFKFKFLTSFLFLRQVLYTVFITVYNYLIKAHFVFTVVYFFVVLVLSSDSIFEFLKELWVNLYPDESCQVPKEETSLLKENIEVNNGTSVSQDQNSGVYGFWNKHNGIIIGTFLLIVIGAGVIYGGTFDLPKPSGRSLGS
jgi:hypothetical protein